MSIIKIQKRDSGFVMIDNKVINDPRLSWKAKGVLVYLLSKPNDWKVQITDVMSRSTDGEHAVRSALQELIDTGYSTRVVSRSEHGTFDSWDYTVYEQPFCGFPDVDKPHVDKPDVENRPLNNTELTNTDNTNIYEEEGDNLQHLLEHIVGLHATAEDVKGLNELESLDVNEDDIRGALAWRVDNDLPPVKRLSQLFEGIKTNRNMRVQTKAARKNSNGHKPTAVERYMMRMQEAERS